jgi:uncharacterized repeat protein (TIGR01451 family)
MLRLLTPGARSGSKKSHTRLVRGAILCLGALSGVLAAAPSALAAVRASAPGPISISVSTPGPVLSGVSSTYTVAVTNNTTTDFSFTSSGGQLPVNWNLNGFGVADDCARSNSNAFGIVRGPAFSCTWAAVGTSGFTALTLSPGATASWTFSATAVSLGTYVDHFTAQGTFATVLGGVSNAVDLSIPVAQGPATGGGGGVGGGGGGGGTTTGLADLQLVGSSSNGSPALGSSFSYKFQDKNSGKADASSVTFDDPLPASVVGTAVSTDTGTCSLDPATNSVHCDLGTFPVGKQATITITATAPAVTGAVTNTASTTFAGTDSNPANNTTSVTVQPK